MKDVASARKLALSNAADSIPSLASSLNNLGIMLSGLGRRGEALQPTQEAVTLYQQLAADNPAYLNDLAMSLNNLGNSQSELEIGSAARRAREYTCV